MTRASSVVSYVALCAGSAAATGQPPWVSFVDETAARLVASPTVGAADVEEKDFAWGDVDHDGDTDLVVVRKQPWTTTGGRRNVLLRNEGGVLVDRTFDYAAASSVMLSDGSTSLGMLDATNDRDVVLADVTGDGWLDIVTAVTLSGPAGHALSHPRVYRNWGDFPPGSGNWQGFVFDDAGRIPAMPDEPRFNGVAAGDVDNDGDVDLYFVDSDSGPYARTIDVNDRLLINDGNGYFTDVSASAMTPPMLDSVFGTSAAIVDVNGDGVRDIVSTDHLQHEVAVAYNDPANPGHFNAFDVISSSAAPEYSALGDVNNDGRVDVVATDHLSDRYLLNQGNGADGLADFVTLLFQFQVGTDDGFAGEAVLSDLNNDGFLDVVVSDVDEDFNGCSRRTHIFRNQANVPDVTLKEELLNGEVAGIPTNQLTGTHDVAVFDLDGDNRRDLILGRCIGLRIFRNVTPGIGCACNGDANADGVRNGGDVHSFVACALAGASTCGCADLNADGTVNAADVTPFAVALLGAGSCP